MSGVRIAALLGAVLLLAACGGRQAAGLGRPHATPTPSAVHGGQVRPLGLAWKLGETFTATVTFDEQDRGAVADELKFTAHERFNVIRREAGLATIRVRVASWHWQRNTSELLTTSLPQPFTFGVDAGGEIVSGVDWPLPSDLPLPGLDVFAAPLASGTGWSRTDGEGAGLSYQGEAGAPPGATGLVWTVVRPQFTMSGEQVTVSGRGQATISSRYRRRGSTVTLRSTREQATFTRTAQSAAGVTQETGTILQTTVFSSP